MFRCFNVCPWLFIMVHYIALSWKNNCSPCSVTRSCNSSRFEYVIFRWKINIPIIFIIHFDYIRYHNLGWGMNPTGLKFFLNYSIGMPGLPALEVKEKPSFSQYKRSAITNFLNKASTRIKACLLYTSPSPRD